MNRDKICPDCEIEYLPHIEKCADCGAVLLLHEEYKRAQEARKRLTEKFIENAVVVREGDTWRRIYIKAGRAQTDALEVLAGLEGNETLGIMGRQER